MNSQYLATISFIFRMSYVGLCTVVLALVVVFVEAAIIDSVVVT